MLCKEKGPLWPLDPELMSKCTTSGFRERKKKKNRITLSPQIKHRQEQKSIGRKCIENTFKV